MLRKLFKGLLSSGYICGGYIYDFSVDYDATDVDDIVEIHKYFMKKKT